MGLLSTVKLKILTYKWPLLGLLVLVLCIPFIVTAIARDYISSEIEGYEGSANVTDIRIYDLSFPNVTVDVTVSVENPHSQGAVVDRIKYDIFFQVDDEWKRLGEADMDDDISIQPYDTANVTVTNKIGIFSAIAMLFEEFQNDKEPVTVKAAGTIWIKLGPLSVDVPFEHIQSLDEIEL